MKDNQKYIKKFREKYINFNDMTLKYAMENGDHELVKNIIIHDDIRDLAKAYAIYYLGSSDAYDLKEDRYKEFIKSFINSESPLILESVLMVFEGYSENSEEDLLFLNNLIKDFKIKHKDKKGVQEKINSIEYVLNL